MASAGNSDEKTRLTEEERGSGRAPDDHPEECPVCMTPFDDVGQRPRNLPCGHTFCTSCINGLEAQGRVGCPSCRTVHTVPEVGQFPISYITESFIKRKRDAKSASFPSKAVKDVVEVTPAQCAGVQDVRGAVCLSNPIKSMLQEQEEKVLATIQGSRMLLCQLGHYQTTLEVWGEQQQHFEDRLQALVDRSKSARVLVRQEQSRVVARKEQLLQGEQQQQVMLQTLRSVTSRKEAVEAIDDSDQFTDKERQRTEEWQAEFPAADTINTIRKVRVASRAAVKAVQAMEAAPDTRNTEDAKSIDDIQDAKDAAETEGASANVNGETEPPAALSSSPSTIMGRLRVLLAPTLEAEDLHLMTPPTRSLLEAGLVFATHEVEGESRHARLTLENDRLYLHHLQDESPPPEAAILQVEDLVPAAPPCLTFLDLKWRGSEARRVLIRLSPDTPRGRQFILLCLGQRGPCYAKTVLLGVINSGKPGECVYGGDYEGNTGGGAALLPGLHKGKYRKSGRAGTVAGVWWYVDGEGCQNSRFRIVTKDWADERLVFPGVFGEVEAGIEVVREAAQQTPITNVSVVDCGVVLRE